MDFAGFMNGMIQTVQDIVEDSQNRTNNADSPYQAIQMGAINNMAANEWQAQQALGRQFQLMDKQMDYTRELRDEQREYDLQMLKDTPALERAAKIAAGINPNYNSETVDYGFQSSPASAPSGGTAPMGAPVDAAAFMNAATGRQRLTLDRFNSFVQHGLQAAAAARDSQRLKNETAISEEQKKKLEADVQEVWSRIDWRDADRNRIIQVSSNLAQENAKNDYELQFLGQTLQNRVERELLQNNLLKSQDDLNKYYGSLLSEQRNNEEISGRLLKIAEQREGLELELQTYLQDIRKQMEPYLYKQFEQDYLVGLSNVVSAELTMLETERKIDIQKLNDVVYRELEALRVQNEKYDLDHHSVEVWLNDANTLTNIFSNGISSGAMIGNTRANLRNATTKAFRANTDRMRFNVGGQYINSPTRGRVWQPNRFNGSSTYLDE